MSSMLIGVDPQNELFKQRSGYFSGKDQIFLLEGLCDTDKMHCEENAVKKISASSRPLLGPARLSAAEGARGVAMKPATRECLPQYLYKFVKVFVCA